MKRSVSSCAVLALVVLPAGAHGQDTEWNRYTLEDLGGVHVSLEANEACRDAGVTASSFEAATSLQLIEAEVGVLTREEMLTNPAMPELKVSLDCAGDPAGGPLAFVVGLRVQQAAQMLRDTQITLPEAVTWYSTEVGVSDAGGISTALEGALTEAIGAFAEAWTSANARDGGGP